MSRSFETMGFLVLSSAAVLAACSGSGAGNGPSEDPPFLAITRAGETPHPGVSSAALSIRSVPGADSSSTFYLAISEKALHEKWFLSAFLKQYFPGAVANGAARSLGTRVVTFRERNGKVYIFDASNNYANSDVFAPALMIEAYPVVSADVAVPNGYIVVDPAAGQHRFGMTDTEREHASTPFKVELAYSQHFRQLDDGATFEEIFTGSSASPIPRADLRENPDPLEAGLERDALRASGTLGLSFRRYAESPSFKPMSPPGVDHYFAGDTHLERDTGQTSKWVAHWAIHPGMKPIRWVLSSEFSKLQKKHPEYDVIGAVERGITNWNQVFGFEALTAEVARDGESPDDDDTNFVYYDAHSRVGYAFANFRTNPNTGEIRGASVYLNSMFPETAAASSASSGATPSRSGSPEATLTQWGSFRTQELCSMPVRNPAATGLLPKDQMEAAITHIILHEVGHTLGLRHNFKGSLVPPSSSVMDYLAFEDSLRITAPGVYDRDALAYLYALRPNAALPSQPFCTDEQLAVDPECAQFDTSDDPLGKYTGPGYQATLTAFLTGKSPAAPDVKMIHLVAKWLSSGRPPQKLQAWEYLIAALRPGVTAGAAPERIEEMLRATFQRLYADAKKPPHDDQLSPKIAQDAADILVGAHDITTRRMAVDVLQALQIEDAHLKLLAARTTIEGQKGNAPATAAADAKLDDLLARIDQATYPYYN